MALVSGLACPDRGKPSFWSGKIFSRGQIAEGHVRTANITVDRPGFDQPPRLGDHRSNHGVLSTADIVGPSETLTEL